MSDVEIPLGLRKTIRFIESKIHLDEFSGDSAFFDSISKMDISNDIYLYMKRKYKDVDSTTDFLCESFFVIFKLREKLLEEMDPLFEYAQSSGSQQRKNEQRLVSGNAEFYDCIGETLSSFGILESLVNRSNNVFSNVGAPFLCASLEQAKKEFNKTKNSNTTNPVISMKLVFYLNKIAKYIDDLEYGAMYESDEMKSKIGGHKKLSFLSKLKTDYLKKVYEANKNLGDNKSGISFGSQEEYERLFGEYFENLDFQADLERVKFYENRKEEIYAHKAGILNQAFIMLASSNPKKTFDRDVLNWGICEDENGGYVFGMNLYSYPMPITVHMQKPFLTHSLMTLKNEIGMLANSKIIIPRYESLRTPDGKIFTTNVLFPTTEIQRSRIREAFRKNPDNPCLAFFNAQIAGRGGKFNRENGYSINELI